jgi:hypothetical protein
VGETSESLPIGLAALTKQLGSFDLSGDRRLECIEQNEDTFLAMVLGKRESMALRIRRDGTIAGEQWFIQGRRVEPTSLDVLHIHGAVGAAMYEAQQLKFGIPGQIVAEPDDPSAAALKAANAGMRPVNIKFINGHFVPTRERGDGFVMVPRDFDFEETSDG